MANGSNPGMGLILLASIAGAVVDAFYLKRGGMKSPKRDKLIALIALGGFISAVAIAGLFGVNGGFLGTITGLFVTLLFAAWELDRWRTRRKNPVLRAK